MNGVVVNLDTAFSPYITSGNLLHVCRAILGHDQQSGGGAAGGGRGGFRGGRGGGSGGRGGFVGGQMGGPPKSFSERDIRELRHKLKTAKVRLTHRCALLSRASLLTCPADPTFLLCLYNREDKRVFQIKAFGQPAGTHTFSLANGNGGGKKGPAPSPVAVAAAASKGQVISTKRAEAPGERVTVAAYFKTRYNKVVDPVSRESSSSSLSHQLIIT